MKKPEKHSTGPGIEHEATAFYAGPLTTELRLRFSLRLGTNVFHLFLYLICR